MELSRRSLVVVGVAGSDRPSITTFRKGLVEDKVKNVWLGEGVEVSFDEVGSGGEVRERIWNLEFGI